MKRNSNVVTFAGNPVTILGRMVRKGDSAKNFVSTAVNLKPVMFSDFQDKIRIISAAPSIDTEVCAQQTRRFNLEASKLPDVQIISISCDLPFALKRFCATEGIENLITVSDHKDVDFGIKYGFLIEELRLLARGAIVVDKQNMVRYVEYVEEITNEPDYGRVLEEVRNLI